MRRRDEVLAPKLHTLDESGEERRVDPTNDAMDDLKDGNGLDDLERDADDAPEVGRTTEGRSIKMRSMSKNTCQKRWEERDKGRRPIQ